MNTAIENKNELESTLSITLTKDDYKPLVEKELAKKSQSVQLKGFRKGKTPKRMIRNMYGQSILVDVVNKLLDEKMREALQENDLRIIGRPIPSEDQQAYAFNPNVDSDYIFKFDLGKYPEFEIKGLGEDVALEIYDVQIPDETVNEELDLSRRRHGKQEEQEDTIEAKDILTLEGKELLEGKVSDDNWETSFTIMVDTIRDEALKNSLLEMKKGDHFEANIFELEKDKDEQYVRKYFLNMDEEEDKEVQPMFQFEILKVERLVPADLDQEFFDKQFGEGKVTTEEEAREALREDIKKFYDQQAEQILFRDIQEKMLELNDIALPDDFLKRFLVSENEETTAEEVENDYENISKSFQWTILRNKLVEEFDVKVEAEDVRNELRGQVAQYMGGYAADEAFMNSMIERLMQDEKQVNTAYENQLGSKLFLRLKNEFKQTPKSIGLEDFQETIKKLNEESQGNQA